MKNVRSLVVKLFIVCATIVAGESILAVQTRQRPRLFPLIQLPLPRAQSSTVDTDRLRYRLQSIDPNNAMSDQTISRQIDESFDARATAYRDKLMSKLFDRRLVGHDNQDQSEWLWNMFAGDARLIINQLAEFV